jgi:hypothetical protein
MMAATTSASGRVRCAGVPPWAWPWQGRCPILRTACCQPSWRASWRRCLWPLSWRWAGGADPGGEGDERSASESAARAWAAVAVSAGVSLPGTGALGCGAAIATICAGVATAGGSDAAGAAATVWPSADGGTEAGAPAGSLGQGGRERSRRGPQVPGRACPEAVPPSTTTPVRPHSHFAGRVAGRHGGRRVGGRADRIEQTHAGCGRWRGGGGKQTGASTLRAHPMIL